MDFWAATETKKEEGLIKKIRLARQIFSRAKKTRKKKRSQGSTGEKKPGRNRNEMKGVPHTTPHRIKGAPQKISPWNHWDFRALVLRPKPHAGEKKKPSPTNEASSRGERERGIRRKKPAIATRPSNRKNRSSAQWEKRDRLAIRKGGHDGVRRDFLSSKTAMGQKKKEGRSAPPADGQAGGFRSKLAKGLGDAIRRAESWRRSGLGP